MPELRKIRTVRRKGSATRAQVRAAIIKVAMPSIDLAGRLRSAIVAMGLSQSTAAMRAKVPEETLSRIITGNTKDPRIMTVLKLASVLNVTVGWLLGEKTAPFTNAESEVLARAMEILEGRIRARGLDAQPNAVAITRSRVPRGYAGRGAKLAFHAQGDSMRESGIFHGDRLFVRPIRDVLPGIDEIVVCRVAGELYVRRLTIVHGHVHLVTDSNLYEPIVVDEKEFALVGVVVGREGELSAVQTRQAPHAS
jgi:SOS-response transcriptional repressor LexA